MGGGFDDTRVHTCILLRNVLPLLVASNIRLSTLQTRLELPGLTSVVARLGWRAVVTLSTQP